MRALTLSDRWTNVCAPARCARWLGGLAAVVALLLPAPAHAQVAAPFLSFPGPEGGYVEVAHDPALNPTSAITVEAWVYLTSYTSYQGDSCPSLVGKDWTESYWLGLCSGMPRFYPTGGVPADATGTVPLSTWTHIAATYDGTVVRFFINGVAAGTDESNSGPPTASDDALRIGSDASYEETPQGFVDEVRLWSVARTEAEIAAAMSTPIATPQEGLVAVWPLDGSAEDPVGGHDGTLVGTVTFVSSVTADCSFSYVVAAGGHLPGTPPTQWVTDLSLLNPVPDLATVTVYLLARDQDNSDPASTRVNIPFMTSALLADVVLERFGESDLAAAFRICSNTPLVVTSRTYNQGATGTFGQGIPGVPEIYGLQPGMVGLICGLHENEAFRTNVGFTNLSLEPATVAVTLFDAEGTWLGDREYTLPPFGHSQPGRLFAEVTDQAVTNGWLSVVATGSPILAYASVIDNVTGDPTYIELR